MSLQVLMLPVRHFHLILKHLGRNNTNGQLDFVNGNGAFNITSLDLLDPLVDGYNFNATIYLHNPTPFTVEMVLSTLDPN